MHNTVHFNVVLIILKSKYYLKIIINIIIINLLLVIKSFEIKTNFNWSY